MLRQLQPTISLPRLTTYLREADGDEDRALKLYLWNAALGESFHLPLQATEIALRNRVNSILVGKFGDEWWRSGEFLAVADEKAKGSLREAEKRITNKKYPIVVGQVVATLSFGFWVAILKGRYNRDIWSSCLRDAFPHLPEKLTRDDVHQHMHALAEFRNRIWHHEPIFKDDITKRWSNCRIALNWMCRDKAHWVQPKCKVMAVMRNRPR